VIVGTDFFVDKRHASAVVGKTCGVEHNRFVFYVLFKGLSDSQMKKSWLQAKKSL